METKEDNENEYIFTYDSAGVNIIIGNFRKNLVEYGRLQVLFEKNKLFLYYVNCEKYFESKSYDLLLKESLEGLSIFKDNLILQFFFCFASLKHNEEIDEKELEKLNKLTLNLFLQKETSFEYILSFVYVYFHSKSLFGLFYENQNSDDGFNEALNVYLKNNQEIFQFSIKYSNLAKHILHRVQTPLFFYSKNLRLRKKFGEGFDYLIMLSQRKEIVVTLHAKLYEKISFFQTNYFGFLKEKSDNITIQNLENNVLVGSTPIETTWNYLRFSEKICKEYCDDLPVSILNRVYKSLGVFNCENIKNFKNLDSIYLHFLSEHPNKSSANFYYKLSLVFSQQSRILLALKSSEECLKINRNPKYLMHYIKLLIKNNQLQEAFKQIENLTEITKTGGLYKYQCYNLLGIIFSRRSRNLTDLKKRKEHEKLCLEYFNNAFELDKTNYTICFNLGLQLSLVRNIKDAKKFASKCLQLNPNDVDSWILTALLISSVDTEEGLKLLSKASIRFSDNTKFKIILIKFLKEGVSGYLRRIEKQIFPDNVISTTSASESSTKKSPWKLVVKQLSNSPEKLFYLFLICDLYIDKKMFTDVEPLLRKLTYIEGITKYADFHYYRGILRKSTDELEMALVIDPNHKGALMNLGINYFQKKEYVKASSYLQREVKIDPSNHESWYYLGKIFKIQGKFEKAQECFFTAMKLEKTAPVMPFERILKLKY